MENRKEVYAIIDVCNWGSTGKIGMGLQIYLKKQEIRAIYCYGRGIRLNTKNCYKIDYSIEVYNHYAKQKISGKMCSGSEYATRRLIKYLRKNEVKGVFLMNLHGYYLNEEIFFDYLSQDNIRVVYLMVDEAPLVGNCTAIGDCSNYKEECIGCNKIKSWQRKLFGEVANKAYKIKELGYSNINAAFVAPEYVINLARTTPLLKGKRLEIVDEAIDVSINIPQDTTELRKHLNISDDKIVIGCVAPFSYPRKGVRFLVEAAKKLENNSRFVFVQVGYDVKDKSGLPKNYIPIGYVDNQKLLTEYYSLSDLFVFPSISDTMPNACLEALACGSPLLCFDISGMPYMGDESVMTLVEPENVDQMVEVIKRTKKKDKGVIDTCRKYALNRFDNQKYFEKLFTIMKSLN